jgi:tRNA uridine 5-carbamoylmethylation protein Kti12
LPEGIGGHGSLHDLDNIIKLTLSLGTIEQLRDRLEETESMVKKAESEITKAKLVESHFIMTKDIIKDVFPELFLHVSGRRVDANQADCCKDQGCRTLKALKEKMKEELNRVEKCQEGQRQRIKDLIEDQYDQDRKVAVFKWCITIRELFDDLYKGVFGTEVERLLHA